MIARLPQLGAFGSPRLACYNAGAQVYGKGDKVLA
jgi:hypothetical protein